MSVPRSVGIPPGVSPVTIGIERGTVSALAVGDPVAAAHRVLLVPGFTGSKEDFLALLPLLAEAGVHAVAIDQLGQYQSRHGQEGPEAWGTPESTITALAADLVQIANQEWPEGPRPHLVGHSMGGLVSRRAVIAAPEAFASLTMLSSGPAAVPAQQRPQLETLRSVLPHAGLDEIWDLKRRLDATAGQPEPPAEIMEFLRTRWLANSPHALSAKAGVLLQEPDLTDQLKAKGVPLYVLYGSDDDVWSPAEQAEMAARLGAGYRALPGAGHSPSVDAPKATTAALLASWGAAAS